VISAAIYTKHLFGQLILIFLCRVCKPRNLPHHIKEAVYASVGAFRLPWSGMGPARWGSGLLCNHCERIPQQVFRDKWIGYGSQHLFAPMEWLPQSPRSCDHALWSFMKREDCQEIIQVKCGTLKATGNTYSSVPLAMLCCFSHCA
jgi:hypothetical protein